MSKPESKLQRKIREALEKEFEDSFWFKVHGGPFQMAGLPDLIGCVAGIYIGIEVKHPEQDHPLSRIQKIRIRQIQEAGGYAACVEDVEDAIELVRRALRKG